MVQCRKTIVAHDAVPQLACNAQVPSVATGRVPKLPSAWRSGGASTLFAGVERSLYSASRRDNLDRQTQRFMDELDDSKERRGILRVAIRAWIAFLIHAALDWIDEESTITRDELRELAQRTLDAAIRAAT